MSRLIPAVLVVCSLVFATQLNAAEPAVEGEISAANLQSLGLGGLSMLSDAEGSQVRGMGNAVAGGSFAWGFLAPLSYSQNVYSASGATFSQGGNHSYAGLGLPNIGGYIGPFSFLGGVLAGAGASSGGGSFARNN